MSEKKDDSSAGEGKQKTRLADNFDIKPEHRWIFHIGATMWLFFFAFFIICLFFLPISLPWERMRESEGFTTFRTILLTLAAVLAVLSALVSLPFSLLRARDSSRQTTATEEGLVTDRINAAVAGLGAQKEVNRLGRTLSFTHDGNTEQVFEWMDDRHDLPDGAEVDNDKTTAWTNIALTEPNLEVRIGAILALERIARENLSFHVQVMKILTAYIRENAPDEDAVPFDIPTPADDAPREKWIAYSNAIRSVEWTEPRTEIQIALTSIGRVSDDQIAEERKANYRLDLRKTNLQRTDLSGLNLRDPYLGGAQMQGAVLGYSSLMGTSAKTMLLKSTNLSAGLNNGGALRFVDFREAAEVDQSFFRNTFGDTTVILPEGIERPCQWSNRELSEEDFYGHWRGWVEIKYSPSLWHAIAPPEWHNVTPIPPPDGCVWQD